MAEKIVCGIDIGSSKTAVIVAAVDENKESIKVIGYNKSRSSGVKKGLIVDIDKVTAVLEESVNKAERMAGRKINKAYVVVGGPAISSLNSHGVVAVSDPDGEITEEDVYRVIDAAKAVSLPNHRELIEILPREYVVNGQEGISNPVGMSGIRLEVETHLITASVTSLKNIDRVLNHTGVERTDFVYSGLASSEAVLSETEKELGVAVIDIGGGKTDLCLFVDGSVAYSASLPVGAKNITNDVAIGMRISLNSAERLKLFLSRELKAGYFSSHNREKKKQKLNPNKIGIPELNEEFVIKDVMDEIILPRYEEIFQLIGEELEKSGFAEAIPSGIVLTGGGALNPGLAEVGKKMLSMPIRVGRPQKITGLIDEVSSPDFSSLVGLILYVKENIMRDTVEFKNFNTVLRNLSFNNYLRKLKDLVKQFIPN